jgi:cytoskeletal protein RodZ
MPETMPRWLVALAGIIAIVVICVGIKDLVQEKKAKSSADTSAATVGSNTTTNPKKSASTKTRNARTSSARANARRSAQAAADNAERTLISEEFAKIGPKAKVVIDNGLNTMSTRNDEEAAMDGNSRVRKDLDMTKACLPLPNLTKPGDVDEPYYRNWAREYSCLI